MSGWRTGLLGLSIVALTACSADSPASEFSDEEDVAADTLADYPDAEDAAPRGELAGDERGAEIGDLETEEPANSVSGTQGAVDAQVCQGIDPADVGDWDTTVDGQAVRFGGIELLHPPNSRVLVPGFEGAPATAWMLHVPGAADVCGVFLAYEGQLQNLTANMSLHPAQPEPLINNVVGGSMPANPEDVKLVISSYADSSVLVGEEGEAVGGITLGPTPVVEARLMVGRAPYEEENMFLDVDPGLVIEVTISDLR